MNFAGYFTWTGHLLFFGNYPRLNIVFVCCQWIKNQNVLMSVFCTNTPECWICILRGPDFMRVFSFSIYLKAFAICSKSYWKSCRLLLQSVPFAQMYIVLKREVTVPYAARIQPVLYKFAKYSFFCSLFFSRLAARMSHFLIFQWMLSKTHQ